MGKYTSSVVKKGGEKTNELHYIWQGLGFLLLIVIPAISIAAGVQTVEYGIAKGWDIPREFLGTADLPELISKSTGLTQAFRWVTTIPNFYAVATASIVYMLVIGGLASFVYIVGYRFVAPPRYGPQDIPPPKFKGKKFKR